MMGSRDEGDCANMRAECWSIRSCHADFGCIYAEPREGQKKPEPTAVELLDALANNLFNHPSPGLTVFTLSDIINQTLKSFTK